MSDVGPMPAVSQVYLGDAVYASFDGWMIELKTGDGRAQTIYLEPSVMQALAAYAKTCGVIK